MKETHRQRGPGKWNFAVLGGMGDIPKETDEIKGKAEISTLA